MKAPTERIQDVHINLIKDKGIFTMKMSETELLWKSKRLEQNNNKVYRD